jgi:hypothetical protein
VEVVVEEESCVPRITDPLAQRDRGDELEDIGNSGVGGDMDINEENNVIFENTECKDEDGHDFGVVKIPDLVLTDEEKVEICVEQGGMQSGAQVTKGCGDKDGLGQRLPTELHDTNGGDENTDAILIVGQTITKLSHSRVTPHRNKGKAVMGSSPEHSVGPKTQGTWKKRARNIAHQVLPEQPPCKDLVSRKRSMEDSLHDHLEGDNSLKKKSKIGVGVVPNNDPL